MQGKKIDRTLDLGTWVSTSWRAVARPPMRSRETRPIARGRRTPAHRRPPSQEPNGCSGGLLFQGARAGDKKRSPAPQAVGHPDPLGLGENYVALS